MRVSRQPAPCQSAHHVASRETLRYPSSEFWQDNDSEDAADDCNSIQTFLVQLPRRGCLAGHSSQENLYIISACSL